MKTSSMVQHCWTFIQHHFNTLWTKQLITDFLKQREKEDVALGETASLKMRSRPFPSEALMELPTWKGEDVQPAFQERNTSSRLCAHDQMCRTGRRL